MMSCVLLDITRMSVMLEVWHRALSFHCVGAMRGYEQPPIGWPSSPGSSTNDSKPATSRVSSLARVFLSRFKLD